MNSLFFRNFVTEKCTERLIKSVIIFFLENKIPTMKPSAILFLLITIMALSSSCNAKTPDAAATGPTGEVFTTSSGKMIRFNLIKHASFEIVYDTLHIQVDPAGKLPPVTDYSTFAKADLILVTHEHFDHFDAEAIKALTDAGRTAIVLNGRCAEMLKAGEAMANGDTLIVRGDIIIEAVPAYNTTPDRQQFHPKGRDNGYVLNLDGFRIYIAGDTEDIPEMANLRDIDVAFLPCNQPYTMTVNQLVNAAKVIKPRVLYPYHFSETPVDGIPELLKNEPIEVRLRNMK